MDVRQKILILRVGRVGDIVMITPAIMAVIELYPDAEIHILTSPDGKRVLRNYHKNIKQLLIYDRSSIFGFLSRHRLKKQIVQNKYSDIFSFEMKPSFLKLIRKSHARVHTLQDYDDQQSYAQQCMKVVSCAAGHPEYNHWMYLPIQQDKQELARRILAEQGISETDFVIAMHPSFSGLRKNPLRGPGERVLRSWPPEYFAELAIKFDEYARTQHKAIKVIIDLLEDERELGQRIVDLSGGVVHLFTPAMDFERYKSTLQRADLVITPNTGPMHIAASVGSRTIALFAGLNPADCGAYVEPDRFIVIRAEDMLQPEQGLRAISPQHVFNTCLPFLPEGSSA